VGTLFTLLFGMLAAGAAVTLAIMASDRARERQAVLARCTPEE